MEALRMRKKLLEGAGVGFTTAKGVGWLSRLFSCVLLCNMA